MISSIGANPPRRPCQICTAKVINGTCSNCGAYAADVANAIASQADMIPETGAQPTRADLKRIFDQLYNQSEALWVLTNTAYRATIVEALTKQQLTSLRRQTLMLVPSAFVAFVIVFSLTRSFLGGFESSIVSHPVTVPVVGILCGFPVIAVIERLIPASNRVNKVPLSVFPSAERRVRIPFALRSDFQFPFVICLAWLISTLL